ncbi:hypothetical protein CS562_18070, partial [Paenibacillus sp. LK1]
LEYTMYRFGMQAFFSLKLFLSTLSLIWLPYKPDPIYITLLNLRKNISPPMHANLILYFKFNKKALPYWKGPVLIYELKI